MLERSRFRQMNYTVKQSGHSDYNSVINLKKTQADAISTKKTFLFVVLASFSSVR